MAAFIADIHFYKMDRESVLWLRRKIVHTRFFEETVALRVQQTNKISNLVQSVKVSKSASLPNIFSTLITYMEKENPGSRDELIAYLKKYLIT